MQVRTYTTRAEAIQAEIVEPIEGTEVVADAQAEYDIDAIADAVLADYARGYACTVDVDEFWKVVAAHDRAAVGA